MDQAGGKMRRILTTVREAFRSASSSPQVDDYESVKDDIAKGVVQRTASGSVRLHRGEFLTEEEMKKEKELARGYNFDESE